MNRETKIQTKRQIDIETGMKKETEIVTGTLLQSTERD